MKKAFLSVIKFFIAHKQQILPISLAVLLVFSLVSLAVLTNRLGSYAASDRNSIFLVPAHPGFSVEDEEQVWGSESHIDLFKNAYDGIGNASTVQSEDGNGIFAPGTEGEYTFNLKNTGNVALDYRVVIDVALHIDSEEISLEEFPLGVRLRHYSGRYLLGDSEQWMSVAELEHYLEEGTLAVNNYAWYTIEWKWLFEDGVIDSHNHLNLSGGDELDTLLGNLSAENPISLSVCITTEATPSAVSDAVGGVGMNETDAPQIDNSQIGGRVRTWPTVLLLVMTAGIAVALGYVWKKS